MTPQEQQQFNQMNITLNKLVDQFYRMNTASSFLLEKALVIAKGFFQIKGRILTNKGIDVVAANDLTLGGDGNVFKITGNTQINAITVGNWTAGSEVTLLFTGTPTVKHNTAGSTGTAKFFLNGSVDLVAANNTVLCVVYDGTQWQEKCRKVA